MAINQMIVSALANPFRLQIIKFLRTGNKNVNELVQHTQLSQSAVSQHLAKLRNAGLVDTNRSGKNIYYNLKYPEISVLADIVESISERTKEHFESENAAVQAENNLDENSSQEQTHEEHSGEDQDESQETMEQPPEMSNENADTQQRETQNDQTDGSQEHPNDDIEQNEENYNQWDQKNKEQQTGQ